MKKVSILGFVLVFVLVVVGAGFYAFGDKGVTGNVVDGTSFEEGDGCSDSDGGVFSFEKGEVVTIKNFLGIRRKYTDRCQDLNGKDAVKEYLHHIKEDYEENIAYKTMKLLSKIKRAMLLPFDLLKR